MDDDDDTAGARLSRRAFEKLGLLAAASMLPACPRSEAQAPELACAPGDGGGYDYVIVGSGAGGGPLACNLARAGFRVLLLEAGSDPESWNREVPALHAASVEEPSMRWDFFVRTYADDARQAKNSRFISGSNGVLYPRAGTLGGCTAHNALITIYPHERDWDEIAETFDDPSWSARNMRQYFERLEHCDYAPRPSAGDDNPSRHGFSGWLHTNVASPWLAASDGALLSIIEAAFEETAENQPYAVMDAIRVALSPTQALFDPNDARVVGKVPEGMVFVPLAVDHGARNGVREYVRAVAAACPTQLEVELDALACRVLWGEGGRAIGIEYRKGARLYRASASPSPAEDAGELRTVMVRREVILAGGVFNSPQLLMLSGVGPRAHLEAHGIEVRVDLPGVGKNLQDRYETSVVSEMADDFAVIEDARLMAPDPTKPDPALSRWWLDRSGPYATNGVVCALIQKSKPELELPDLFLFGLVGSFRGYYPGFSRDLVSDKRHFTWGILKAHTHNVAGEVRLRSADPRDTPAVDFHYFDEGSPGAMEDLNAVVAGVHIVRRIMRGLGDAVEREVLPGPEVRTGADVGRFVRDQAWGHHASCSNKMGPKSDPMAVVDQRFRVHGTTGLRVVDASVFPRIPGFFVVTSVYMIAEKASDVIIEDARKGPGPA